MQYICVHTYMYVSCGAVYSIGPQRAVWALGRWLAADQGDGGRERGLAVVDVANGADVHVVLAEVALVVEVGAQGIYIYTHIHNIYIYIYIYIYTNLSLSVWIFIYLPSSVEGFGALGF